MSNVWNERNIQVVSCQTMKTHDLIIFICLIIQVYSYHFNIFVKAEKMSLIRFSNYHDIYLFYLNLCTEFLEDSEKKKTIRQNTTHVSHKLNHPSKYITGANFDSPKSEIITSIL